MKPKAVKISIDQIVIDDHLYPRSKVNDYHVARLRYALKSGAHFPPLVIEKLTRRLVDGRHRYTVFRDEEIKEVEVIEKVYASEADLYADAVRYNVAHGELLDQFSVRNAIIRLIQYGYEREKISEIVRLPLDQLGKIERGFATSVTDGKPVALKGGLDHLRGQLMTEKQQEINRQYSGRKASFHARQLADLLEAKMWPMGSEIFAEQMDRLCRAWEKIREATKAA